MAKKIFDILPPKIAHKIEDGIKSITKEEKKHTKSKVNTKHHKEVSSNTKKHFPLKEVLVCSGILFS